MNKREFMNFFLSVERTRVNSTFDCRGAIPPDLERSALPAGPDIVSGYPSRLWSVPSELERSVCVASEYLAVSAVVFVSHRSGRKR